MTKGIPCDICGEPTSSRTLPARGYSRHHGCLARHDASRYRRGCRCGTCRAAHATRLRRYVADVRTRDGVSPTAQLRRVRAGRDPLAVLRCVECGEPLALWSDSAEPRHKRCKRGHIADYEVKRAAVVERDGINCWLCESPVDFDAAPDSDWYPSLDHVTPRSRAGSDEVENLNLAHRWCNSVRSDDRVPVSFFR